MGELNAAYSDQERSFEIIAENLERTAPAFKQMEFRRARGKLEIDKAYEISIGNIVKVEPVEGKIALAIKKSGFTTHLQSGDTMAYVYMDGKNMPASNSNPLFKVVVGTIALEYKDILHNSDSARKELCDEWTRSLGVE